MKKKIRNLFIFIFVISIMILTFANLATMKKAINFASNRETINMLESLENFISTGDSLNINKNAINAILYPKSNLIIYDSTLKKVIFSSQEDFVALPFNQDITKEKDGAFTDKIGLEKKENIFVVFRKNNDKYFIVYKNLEDINKLMGQIIHQQQLFLIIFIILVILMINLFLNVIFKDEDSQENIISENSEEKNE